MSTYTSDFIPRKGGGVACCCLSRQYCSGRSSSFLRGQLLEKNMALQLVHLWYFVSGPAPVNVGRVASKREHNGFWTPLRSGGKVLGPSCQGSQKSKTPRLSAGRMAFFGRRRRFGRSRDGTTYRVIACTTIPPRVFFHANYAIHMPMASSTVVSTVTPYV